MTSLGAGSLAALAAVRARGAEDRAAALARIAAELTAAGLTADVTTLIRSLLARSRVTLHFHPDRRLPNGGTVAQALREEGVYRSQYETRISSGGLTAFPGGDRDEWERRLFAGAYQLHDTAAVDRPKYGALNLGGFVNGPAPAFGSCALVLRSQAASRTTFLFGDSSQTHADVGTADAFTSVLAALLDRVGTTGQMLGLPEVSVRELVEHLERGAAFPPSFCHALDDYIETHTHGPIGLAADAQALLIDPSYRGTLTGDCLLQAAERNRLQVAWHPGSQLTLARFPAAAPVAGDAARWERFLAGGGAARLAERVVRECSPDGTHLTAAAIGAAVTDFERSPERWAQWGAPDPNLTAFKDLWRILVCHGRPTSEVPHAY